MPAYAAFPCTSLRLLAAACWLPSKPTASDRDKLLQLAAQQLEQQELRANLHAPHMAAPGSPPACRQPPEASDVEHQRAEDSQCLGSPAHPLNVATVMASDRDKVVQLGGKQYQVCFGNSMMVLAVCKQTAFAHTVAGVTPCQQQACWHGRAASCSVQHQ